MPTHGDIARVRAMVGGTDPANLSDADITFSLNFGESQALSRLGIETWGDLLPTQVDSIIAAEEFFAAQYCMMRFPEMKDVRAQTLAEAQSIVDNIATAEPTEIDVDAIVDFQDYESWPMNRESGSVYIATRPFGGTTGGMSVIMPLPAQWIFSQ